MIAICISILCAILIFTTWRLELLTRTVSRLENELSSAQVELHNLKGDVSTLMYKEEEENDER